MATTMFAGFTSSDRRKKVVYGKASRPVGVPPPAPSPAPNEDAPPSPDRPRKQSTALKASPKKPRETLESGQDLGYAPDKGDDVDIFAVPSEDEFLTRPTKPTKKPQTKRRNPAEGLNAPISKYGPPQEVRKIVKSTQPLHKAMPARPAAVAKKPQKPPQLPQPSRAPASSPSDPIPPRTIRGRTPQSTKAVNNTRRNGAGAQASTAKTKAPSRATTPLPPLPKTQKMMKTISTPSLQRGLGKPAAQTAEDAGVFDMPLSDEEEPQTVKKVPHLAPSRKTKEASKNLKATPQDARKDSAESDDSSTSKKRKRRASVLAATAPKPILGKARQSSAPQRNSKYQKKEAIVSVGHEAPGQPAARPTREPPSKAPALNKASRTRQRTVPVLAPRVFGKGQSSPATLDGMLRNFSPSKASHAAEVPDVAELDDQTMYDIPDPLTTPVRQSQATIVPGSTTPRQRNLFGGLLGDFSPSETPMPSMAALQLTDRKPKSLIGSLARSKSDVTYSAQARKTRLIETLKPTESSDEDEDEDEDSAGESEKELSVRNVSVPSAQKHTQKTRLPANISDEMEVDVQATTDSQTSQVTSGFGIRPKLTYAMSRSYLKEANPEDDLLISMDLNDDLGTGSQSIQSVSEDEPDPMSQAQAHHELKSRGRNFAFEQEIETLLEDMSSTRSNSIRRSTMLELCTKMADKSFTSQLLDSPQANQFFRHVAANGDVIFEFTTAVATIFILQTNPTYTVLTQLQAAHIITTLMKLIGQDMDIRTIAKERKTNLSKIARESVITFRNLIVEQSAIWSSTKPSKVSPQLVALKAMETLVVGLRRAGNTEALLDQTSVAQLAEIASKASRYVDTDQLVPDDHLILNMVLSTLESLSATRQKHFAWPVEVLQHIAEFMPIFFRPDATSLAMLAVKLCMSLTNNKPKACQPFSAKSFVQPLASSIVQKFQSLNAGLAQEERTEVLESLILSLGATINLAEFSDQMRVNIDDGEGMMNTLVEIFLEGSERASQASSVEESHSGVAVGYLAVLLGNLCLNKNIRSKMRALLPDQRLDTLIDSIKEFVRVHQHVDSKAEEFEGAEGQETLQTYTARLMLVVERLEITTD